MNGWAGWEDWGEDRGVGVPGSAEARADERSAVAEAAKGASAAVDMEGEEGTTAGETPGETPGLGVGVGANVTRGLVRRAGVLDDVLGPLLRRAETRLRIAPGRARVAQRGGDILRFSKWL